MIEHNYLHPQIPLQFQEHEQYNFDGYIADTNHELISVLKSIANGEKQDRVYLWGESELGKSHLLHATCKLAQENQLSAIYLPLAEVINLSPDLLKGVEQYDIICIDDLETLKEHTQWQESLFHLYNQVNDANKSMLITSVYSIKQLDLALVDLSSRLSWGLVYHLQSLSDDSKKVLLQQKAELRGFELNNDVVNYLIIRSDRSMTGILGMLDQLDQASLSEKRKITIPFVKKLLEQKTSP